MNYIDLLQPLLSPIAHLLASQPGSCLPGDGSALRRECDRRLADIRSRRGGFPSRHFDAACLAIEELIEAALPPETTSLSVLADSSGGEPFFTTLQLLLDETGYDASDRERAQALEVFATCLALGYRGRAPGTVDVNTYLRRCREELAAAIPLPAFAPAPPEPVAPGTTRAFATMAPFWLIPVAVTLAIYSLYSLILSDLCALALQ